MKEIGFMKIIELIGLIMIGILSLFGASFYSAQELNSANRDVNKKA